MAMDYVHMDTLRFQSYLKHLHILGESELSAYYITLKNLEKKFPCSKVKPAKNEFIISIVILPNCNQQKSKFVNIKKCRKNSLVQTHKKMNLLFQQ